MAKISGILTDGAGQIINDCTIELYAKKTTSKVLTQTQTFQVSENGKYSMNVLPCEYEVSLIINGFPKKRLGIINVYSDSLDGTLNDYLINPEDSDLTPEFLKQIFDARNDAIKSAINAKNWATTVDSSNFIKKSSDEKQRIDGKLDVHELTVNDMPVITDLSSVHNKINTLNDRVYVVESYSNDNSWYRIYSDGFIEQSDAQFIETPVINTVCPTFINLLKPMKSCRYGVSIDKVDNGPWAQTEFAYANLEFHGFWITSFTPSFPGRILVRWTVRGY